MSVRCSSAGLLSRFRPVGGVVVMVGEGNITVVPAVTMGDQTV